MLIKKLVYGMEHTVLQGPKILCSRFFFVICVLRSRIPSSYSVGSGRMDCYEL